MQRIIAIDTETAGLDPKDGVVDIAIIEVDNNLQIVDSYTSLIDPEGPISPSASGVHGIVRADVEGAPTLSEFFAHPGISDYCDAPLFVIGHNVQFDLRFLAEHFRGEITPICTLRLARHLYPDAENHKLQTLRFVLGIEAGEGNSHSAFSDTILALNLLRHIAAETSYDIQQLACMSSQTIKVEKMPFGKHKGLALSSLPTGYRRWLLDQDIDEDLRQSLQPAVS